MAKPWRNGRSRRGMTTIVQLGPPTARSSVRPEKEEIMAAFNRYDPATWPRVFIVGGGFAGIAAAKALKNVPVQVTMVDRRNHHVFQPLLYQVATAALSPADIAAPIRSVLRKCYNCRVVLAKIRGVDLEHKRLRIEGGAVEYDYLILAAGATHSYFGHPEFEKIAPGLK